MPKSREKGSGKRRWGLNLFPAPDFPFYPPCLAAGSPFASKRRIRVGSGGHGQEGDERLEKTQTYNLSLEASAHDLLAAVTSTRRAPVPQGDRGRKRV